MSSSSKFHLLWRKTGSNEMGKCPDEELNRPLCLLERSSRRLEGLRQKGWSVLNLLVILRESKVRNTKVRTLAPGDNQVICTQYKAPGGLTEVELSGRLKATFRNPVIMDTITEGTSKLGLIINQKKTLVSSDYLCYGKVPVICGNIELLEGKRYLRITCIPNDQLLSLGNNFLSRPEFFDCDSVQSLRTGTDGSLLFLWTFGPNGSTNPQCTSSRTTCSEVVEHQSAQAVCCPSTVFRCVPRENLRNVSSQVLDKDVPRPCYGRAFILESNRGQN